MCQEPISVVQWLARWTEKKKRKNAKEKETKPVVRPLSIIPEPDEVEEAEPQPTPRVPSPVAHPTAQPIAHSLDETFDVPTPAMIEVMSKRNDKKSAVKISLLLDSLEYIHHCGYVHADLKPANVLLGVDSSQAIVNIVDFGLASRYKDTDDNHKAHIVEKKSAHNGTLIYTSLVAHRGAKTTSRICDIEILAYNLLHLNTGSLPWTAYEQQPEKVLAMKEELLKDPAKFFTTHYKEPVPDVFVEMFKYIASTKFEVAPDYDKLKQMFVKALQKNGLKMDGKLNFEEKKVNGTATRREEQWKLGNHIVVTQDEDEEEEEGGEEVAPNGDVHIEEEALRYVNTTKRRVRGKPVDKVEEEEAEGEDEKQAEPKEKKLPTYQPTTELYPLF
ncbi:serine/threonine-protein kinase VRK1-like [Diaphorina citri]|uniref:non-specific serine/threonine protein kinase n=1 Tax=Diaphorina citri TaxID=121845 RepID=A0A1S4EG15_DIACI|nr:serine/threonine-protein kinase VRK1-like [Diaphorina citri]